MKNSLKILGIFIALLGNQVQAQMSGTYNVPSTFTSIAAAISSLNISGVSGPVAIQINAGYTETAPAGGYSLGVIAGTSSVNTITFQKTGLGANPLISAYVGTATPSSATQDGVWWLVGSDYVTIDGIDITDPNTTNPATMEFGYGFYKASVIDGCQNNTIKNCVITLNRVNNAAGAGPAVDGSRGIDVMNATAASNTVALTITASTGANSNNKFYSNTIQNCNIGIAHIGFAASTPFTLADTGNDIGGSSSATGNTIINFGGGGTTSAAAGVRTLAQYNINISYNTLNNNNGGGVLSAQVLRGIYLNTATSANATVNSNTLSIKGGGTTQQLSVIENASGSTAASNTISISNNLITNCSYATATSPSFYNIYNTSSPAVLSINNNTLLSNTSSQTSGSYYCIYNTGAVTGSISINSNIINLGTFSGVGTSLAVYGIYNTGGSATCILNANSNTFQSMSIPGGGSGTTYLIYNSATQSVVTYNGNNFNNLSVNSSGGFYFMYCSTSTPNTNVTNNFITTAFNKTLAGGTVYGYYNFSGGTGTALFSGNNFSNITLTGATTFNGLYHYTGSSNLYNFNGNIFSNITTGGSAITVMYVNSGNTGSSVFNNSISNIIGGNIIYGIYTTVGATSMSMYSNTITAMSTTGAATAYGIYQSGATNTSLYKNKIYDIQANNASGVVYGIYISGGTIFNVYNNLIGDLRTPIANAAIPLAGIYINGSTTTNLYYNTVNLNATSSGALFGSAAFYATTGTNVNLRNNIFVNNSVATGAGITAAYRRTSTTLTSYSVTSNNNLYYAGSSGANNVLFYDGTNSVQTISAFKTLMSTRDGLSVTENPVFTSTVGSNPSFLYINTLTPTQIESGGSPVSGITDDYLGTTRNVTTPDIGALEGSYTPVPPCSGVPAISSLVSTQAAVCPSVSFNLSSSGTYSNTGIAYQWLSSTTGSTSGFSAISNATTTSLTYTDLPSTTWFQLAITCTNSGSGFTTTALPVVLGTPTVTALGSTTFMCAGQSVNLSLSGAGPGLLYQWVASTTSSNSGFSAITNATLSTRSNTGAIGSNWFGAVMSCSANITFTTVTNALSVIVGAVPTATAAASASLLCASANLSLTGTTDVGSTFSWSGPSSYTSNIQNPVLTNSGSGLYSFIASLNTCSSTVASVSVTTNGRLFLNAPSVTPTLICVGGTTQLKAMDYATSKVNLYGFTSSASSALITMTSGSVGVIGSSNDDTPMAAPASIGFTFNYNGVDYTQFTASPDGWIMLGTQVGSNEFSNSVIATNNVPKIYPYWDDLATGTNGYVRTQVFGSAPTRTFVVEWYVTIPRNTVGPANSTFQALLHEATGQVEFRYGTLGSASMSASSGLTGNAVTYNSLTLTGPTNSTATPNDANANQPASGTSYLFTPPSLTYSWSSPGSATLSSTSGSAITSTAIATTIYSVDLGYLGCTTTRTMTVTVNTPPVINIVASNTAVCPGGSATLTASGATTYSWDSGSTNTVVIVTPTTNVVTYTVQGVVGPCTASNTISITIPGTPTINVSGSSGICTGQNASLTANGANTYSWNTGSTSNSIVTTPTTNTTYTVTGTNTLGCSTTTTQLVTVAASLSISIVGPSSICVGQAANLSGNGGVTYTWSTGAFTSTITPTPTTTTTYSIIGASGTCSNTASKIITVNSNPTVSVLGNSVICSGQSTTLTVSGGNTYSWSTGAVTSTTAVSPTINSTYTVTGTSVAGCSSSITTAVVSNSLPVIAVAQSAGTVCVATPATFTASGAATYTWVNGANTSTFAATPSVASVYTVNATTSLGCSSTKTVALATYSLPIVSIAPSSATVCSLSQANFTASGASSYTWNGTISGASVSFTPTLATTYSVIGISSQGCISSNTVGVTTNTLPVVIISPPSATVCSLAIIEFTASGASTYTWNNSTTGATYLSAPPNTITYTVAGTNSLGCSSSNTVAVTTLSLPVVVITPSLTTLCVMSTGIFTVAGANTYTWSNSTLGNTVAITPTNTSQYSVIGTDVNGCTSMNSLVILTNPLPTLAISPGSATVCPNAPQSFTASGANTYSWSTGITTSSVVITPSISNIYSVSGTDANGCVGSQTLAITTKTAPLIVISPPSTSVCLNSSATFSANGALSYTWSTGSTSIGILVTPSVTTVYTVSGKNTIGCVSSTTANLTVWQPPVIQLTASSLTVCARETVTLTASGASTYTWSPFNFAGTTLTNNPTSTLIYSAYGVDVNGCSNSNSITVVVDKCTGISKIKGIDSRVTIYPNPSTGLINADFGFEGAKEIRVLNAVGAMIMKISTDDLHTSFDLSGYAKGVYFVHVTTNGASENYKIVIQ